MKFCCYCNKQFGDEFLFCPLDATALETISNEAVSNVGFMLSHDPLPLRLWRGLSATVSDFFRDPSAFIRQTFIGGYDYGLEPPTLLLRLWVGLINAAAEFRRDPKAFLVETFARDAQGMRRKKLLRAGVAISISVYAIILIVIGASGRELRPSVQEDLQQIAQIIHIAPLSPLPVINKPKKERAQGGGGGGNHETRPPSIGRSPRATMYDPIVAATSRPSLIERPSLPVEPTVRVQPELLPVQMTSMPLGLPDGVVGPPSDGPGSGKGIGTGSKGGVGPGDGIGVGPGKDFNMGDGNPSLGGLGSNNDLNIKPIVLFAPTPKYTEEARREKIQGKVLLSVVFGDDGRIRDVKVIRGLGYGLDEQAIIAAQQIKFKPAMKNDRAISIRHPILVEFRLL